MLRLLTLALVAFSVFLLAQFPARWAAGALPRGSSCRQLDGSIWNGTCTDLTASGTDLGNLGWSVHPLALLRARLNLDLTLARGSGGMSGKVEFGRGGLIVAHELLLQQLTLDHQLLAQLPRGARATLQGRLTYLKWTGHRFSAIEGRLDVQQLRGSDGTRLGDYQLTFPPGQPGTPTAQIQDLGGPLRVRASLQLTAEPGFVLAGEVAARASAAPDLADAIRYLGSPDSQGLRPFSIAGTF